MNAMLHALQMDQIEHLIYEIWECFIPEALLVAKDSAAMLIRTIFVNIPLERLRSLRSCASCVNISLSRPS
jgi:hypothetical protein